MTKKLNSFHLKIIAIIAMTINHFGKIFAPHFNPFWWNFFYEFFGKLTFPIMAFLLIEGYKHTNRFSRYVSRLVAFALLAILPFHFALRHGQPIYPFNNVLFTLTIGLIMLKLMDRFPKMEVPILILASISTFASDWNIIGIIIIYFFKKYKHHLPLIILTFTVTFLEYDGSSNPIAFAMLGIFMTIPILIQYNGERGPSNNFIKYGFYAYYPIHLTIILILQVIYARL